MSPKLQQQHQQHHQHHQHHQHQQQEQQPRSSRSGVVASASKTVPKVGLYSAIRQRQLSSNSSRRAEQRRRVAQRQAETLAELEADELREPPPPRSTNLTFARPALRPRQAHVLVEDEKVDQPRARWADVTAIWTVGGAGPDLHRASRRGNGVARQGHAWAENCNRAAVAAIASLRNQLAVPTVDHQHVEHRPPAPTTPPPAAAPRQKRGRRCVAAAAAAERVHDDVVLVHKILANVEI